MASHGVPLNTLKDCLQFLKWLHDRTDVKDLVAYRLVKFLENRYNNVDQKKIAAALYTFLSNVSTFHTKLCTKAEHGKHKPTTTKNALNALLECVPRILSAVYFLRYQVDVNFKALGGGDWAEQQVGRVAMFAALRIMTVSHGSKIDEYLVAKNGVNKYGVIPGGFEPGELKQLSAGDYSEGRFMVTDLINVLNKTDGLQNYFLDVFTTTVLSASGTDTSNVANALRLVEDFCRIFEDSKNETEFKMNVETRGRCINWQELQEHCATLKMSLGKIFTPSAFSFTGYGRQYDKLKKNKIDKKMAKWLKDNLSKVRGHLGNIEPFSSVKKFKSSTIRRSNALSTNLKTELAAYFSRNFICYGFTFHGNRYDTNNAPYKVLENDWTNAIRELNKSNGGLDKLVEILKGAGCDEVYDDEEPEPDDVKLVDVDSKVPPAKVPEAPKEIVPEKKVAVPKNPEGNQNQGKKAEGAQNQGKKAEGAQNQGKKVEGAQNQGKKAEGAQNQGKKGEGTPSQENGQSEEKPGSSPVVQAAQTQSSSVPSADSGSSGDPVSSSGKGADGQTGDSHAGQTVNRNPQPGGAADNTTSEGLVPGSPGAGGGGESGGKESPKPNAPTQSTTPLPMCDLEFLMKHVSPETPRCQPKHKPPPRYVSVSNTYMADTIDKANEDAEERKKLEEMERRRHMEAARRRNLDEEEERKEQDAIRAQHRLVPVSDTHYKNRNGQQNIAARIPTLFDMIDEYKVPTLEGKPMAYKYPEDSEKYLEYIFRKKERDDFNAQIEQKISLTKLQDEEKKLIAKDEKDANDYIHKYKDGHTLLVGSPIPYVNRKFSMSPPPNSKAAEQGSSSTASPNTVTIDAPIITINSHFAGDAIPISTAQLSGDSNLVTYAAHESRGHAIPLTMVEKIPPLHPITDFTGEKITNQNIKYSSFPYSPILKLPQPPRPHLPAAAKYNHASTDITKELHNVNPFVTQPTGYSIPDLNLNTKIPNASLDPLPPINLKVERAYRLPQSPDTIEPEFVIDVAERRVPDHRLDFDLDFDDDSTHIKTETLPDSVDPTFPAIFFNLPPPDVGQSMPPRKDFDPDIIQPPTVQLCLSSWTTKTPTPGSTDIPETNPFPAEAPRTVRDMLTWLAGLRKQKHHDTLEKCINKAFGGLYSDPSQLVIPVNGHNILPDHVFDILQLTSMFASSVLNSIAPNWKAHASSRTMTTKSTTQSDEPDCCVLLCQLRDYVYACCHQLQFLRAQCSRNELQGGWMDHKYGSDLKTSSPLQAFLTDDWNSKFETHPFDPCNLCLKSRVKMGFKKNDLSNDSQTGSTISAILTPSCGGSDPLLTLSSYLNCLTKLPGHLHQDGS